MDQELFARFSKCAVEVLSVSEDQVTPEARFGDDLDAEEHPDYYHIDADQVQDGTDGEKRRRQIFKAIALPSKDDQVNTSSIST